MDKFRLPRKTKKKIGWIVFGEYTRLSTEKKSGLINDFKIMVHKCRINVYVFPKSTPEFIDVTICKSLLV